MVDPSSPVAQRAAVHRALGDERRLLMVDALQHSDRSVTSLAELTGLSTNLLAFHLRVLEDAGLIRRTVSQGDARRRYVGLEREALELLERPPPLDHPAERVAFLCTANSARSQLAAHLWRARTGRAALSAGTDPAAEVHPTAVEVARRHGLDLTGARPTGYRDIELRVDLLVSVCDRAHETAAPADVTMLHWSVPDPVGGDDQTFEDVFAVLSARVERLATSVQPGLVG